MEVLLEICRLCGSLSKEVNQETNFLEWISLDYFLDGCNGGETVSSVIKSYVPGSILVNLPNNKIPQVLCRNCYTDLLRLVEFFNRIREGQKMVMEKLNFTPKRRGRPKKGSKAENLKTSEAPIKSLETVLNVNPIGKRSCRLPDRYASKEENKKSCQSYEESLEKESQSHEGSLNELLEDRENADNPKDPTVTLSTISHTKYLTGKRRKRGRPKSKKSLEFKCDSCEKTYNNYSSLVYHKVATHKKTKNFTCDICKKSFSHKSILTNHMFVHSSDKSFKCEVCDANFQTRNRLATHVKNAHTNPSSSDEPFVYGTFKTPSTLALHGRMHSEKCHECEHCGKTFNRRGNLKEHMRTHTKEKPFVCDFPDCGKCFTTASQLKSHKFLHSTAKRFLCIQCGQGFNNHANLAYHMKRHSGEKSHECHVCHKKFFESSSLKRHVRIHSAEKQYQCDTCDKKYRDRANLSRHKKTHLNKSPREEKKGSSEKIIVNEGTIPEEEIAVVNSSEIASTLEVNDLNVSFQDIAAIDSVPSIQIAELEAFPASDTLVHILNSEALVDLRDTSQPLSDGRTETIYIYSHQTNELFPVSKSTDE